MMKVKISTMKKVEKIDEYWAKFVKKRVVKKVIPKIIVKSKMKLKKVKLSLVKIMKSGKRW